MAPEIGLHLQPEKGRGFHDDLWLGCCKRQIQGLPLPQCYPCIQPDLQMGRGLYTGWMISAAKRTSTLQFSVSTGKQLVDILVGGKEAVTPLAPGIEISHSLLTLPWENVQLLSGQVCSLYSDSCLSFIKLYLKSELCMN